MSEPPDRICIGHDDDYAKFVGRTQDGKQFFVTQPFVPYGHDFVARYLFDEDGQFLNAMIHDLGERSTGEPPCNALFNNADAEALQKQLLDELGDVAICDINVSPFSYESHDTTFGLIPEPPDEDDDDWTVIAEPGNYMAFCEPWDGEYYT